MAKNTALITSVVAAGLAAATIAFVPTVRTNPSMCLQQWQAAQAQCAAYASGSGSYQQCLFAAEQRYNQCMDEYENTEQ